ncbi:MAG: DNA helicase II, partial [Alphaproteobacteria bacterium]
KGLFISHVASRNMYGSWISAVPSRFIEEIPDELVHSLSQSGMVQSGRSRHWDSSGFQAKDKSVSASQGRRVKSENGDILSRGDRVFHDKFGYGKIINIDGHKLDIAFEKGSTKRVMDSFVEKV